MKQIIAYIKPNMLSKVAMALHDLEGLTGLSATKVQGFGRHRAKDAQDRIVENMVEYVPHIKIEIFCKDELADRIATIITENAHTGLRGDGKVYVAPVEQAVRISTGEKGERAI
jgi:nitrogen regulatory protein P-II 1